MKKISIFLVALLSLAMVSCGEDYLETAPTGSVAEKDMIASLSGAETVLDGINRATYTFYSAHDRFGQKSIDYINDCLGDDFYPTEEGYKWFVAWYRWITHRSATASNLEYVWAYYYDIINNANLILSNVEPMVVMASEENQKKNILAQCYTYRAYALYNLVQYYGEGTLGVPVPLAPNPGALERSSVADVYNQINTDLTNAITAFTNGGSSISRVNASQINIDVTYAIAARVALTTEQWADAAAYAEKAYAKHPLCDDYTYGWNKVNDEWIWGALLIDEQQTSYASFFSHMDPFFGGYCSLGNHHCMSEQLFNFLPKGDARKYLQQPDVYLPAAYYVNYFGSKPRSSFKYTGWGEWTNDYLYIKSGEMYIIAAEAYARLGEDSKAQRALNTLNYARWISDLDGDGEDLLEFVATTKTGDELLEEILMYRRAELWGDGQRFFDMKRLNIGCEGRAGQPLAEQTASIPAGDKRFTFLIPQQEMDSNPKMVQNTL